MHSYRADIDGLRAIAIILVLLFHFGIPGFSAGFFGVDIFFVVSGYLISNIICSDIKSGSFSLLVFYERRVRRIFPALAVVLSVTLLVTFAIFGPNAMKELGNEIQRSATFTTNFYFAQATGYFGAPSKMQPLLHSWSLSVEEQFYILAPVLLYLMHKQNRTNGPIVYQLLFLFFLSLGASILCALYASTAGFYLLPSRAWELLCGMILAVWKPPPPSRVSSEILVLSGAAGIGLSLILFRGATIWPGAGALIPCLASVAIIRAGACATPPLASRLLGWRPMIWLGKISYPLYLWHWPVLVIFRHETFRPPNLPESAALILLVTLLAAATTAWIEKPIRAKRLFPNRRRLLVHGLVMLVLCFGIGRTIVLTNGLPQRFSAAILYQAGWGGTDESLERFNQKYCRSGRYAGFFGGSTCLLGEQHPSGALDFVVWGDSHASALLPAFARLARQHGKSGEIFFDLGCAPLLTPPADTTDKNCQGFNAHVLDRLKQHPVKHLFLIGHWLAVPGGAPSGDATALKDLVKEPIARADTPSAEGDQAAFKSHVLATLTAIREAGSAPFVLEDNPIQQEEVGDIAFVAILQDRYGSLEKLAVRRDDIQHDLSVEDALFQTAAHTGAMTYLPTLDLLCGQEICPIFHDKLALYRDADHLTEHGADLLLPALEIAFQRID